MDPITSEMRRMLRDLYYEAMAAVHQAYPPGHPYHYTLPMLGQRLHALATRPQDSGRQSELVDLIIDEMLPRAARLGQWSLEDFTKDLKTNGFRNHRARLARFGIAEFRPGAVFCQLVELLAPGYRVSIQPAPVAGGEAVVLTWDSSLCWDTPGLVWDAPGLVWDSPLRWDAPGLVWS